MKKNKVILFILVVFLSQPLLGMQSDGRSSVVGGDAPGSPAGLGEMVTELIRLNQKPKKEYEELRVLRMAVYGCLRPGCLTYLEVVSWGVCWETLGKIMHVGPYTEAEVSKIKECVRGIEFIARQACFEGFEPQYIYVLFGLAEPKE